MSNTFYTLPPDYIDPEHTGEDRELLENFYVGCNAEGGTADEMYLRGIKAVLGHPATPPVPESGEVGEGPSVEEVAELCKKFGFRLADPTHPAVTNLRDMIRAAIARWGRPSAPPAPGASVAEQSSVAQSTDADWLDGVGTHS
jgi:hypothetical protein